MDSIFNHSFIHSFIHSVSRRLFCNSVKLVNYLEIRVVAIQAPNSKPAMFDVGFGYVIWEVTVTKDMRRLSFTTKKRIHLLLETCCPCIKNTGYPALRTKLLHQHENLIVASRG